MLCRFSLFFLYVSKLIHIIPSNYIDLKRKKCYHSKDIYDRIIKHPVCRGKDTIPQLVATVVVVVSYKWKYNTFLSIGAGTACNMLLLHVL